jgi:GTP-binding protein
MSRLPTVAIVGRPNVGKSTLFNRLSGKRLAVVHERAGTTRDRLISEISRDNLRFQALDTGGLFPERTEEFAIEIRTQIQIAMEEADFFIFVTDSATGLTPADSEIAEMLRPLKKTVVLAANKCDGHNQMFNISEFYRLGLGDPVPFSALHNRGIDEILDRLTELIPLVQEEEPSTSGMKLSLIGKPNVGKSSMLNAIFGEERAIVSPIPGTTRDAIDTPIIYQGNNILLVDTAGIRKRGKIDPGLEKYSVLRSFQAIERCDVAILIIDATDMITAQDAHIAGYIVDSYRGLVIALNKWDLAARQGWTEKSALDLINQRLSWLSYAPVFVTSAVDNTGINGIMNAALDVYQQRFRQVTEKELDDILLEKIAAHPPPSKGRKHLRIFSLRQTGSNPPTFLFTVNYPELLHFSYKRFLQNTLRIAFGYSGSLIKLEFNKWTRATDP